jgi:hypothetical protein
MSLRIFLWLALIVGLLFAFDRLLLYMERRGCIYYRKKKSSPGSVGNAFLEIQKFLEPSKKYVLQIRKEEKREQEETGNLNPEADDSDDQEPD